MRTNEANPFAILEDPGAMARAESAWAAAWSYVEHGVPAGDQERQSQRMKFVVASVALGTDDPREMANKAIQRFLKETRTRRP
ncbi:hypothetical protein [Bosea sp. NBC_00550]|uniref:hypothetical protein n=1 Tax=Bosea sp. NBC_00550 TaxID=2969621 RepID=UPI00222FDE9E|nr:hypothetical protein [Bosea sp. NBC_00550]UZF95704.1 hypothetical protein NWE53_27300 [Bosea sp. NBC_00550]